MSRKLIQPLHDRALRASRTSAVGLVPLMLVLVANSAGAADVEVAVANVNHAAGHVRAALCTQASFLKNGCPYKASAPAREGETVITFTGVAPGEYAVQAFHDDTDGGKVHQDALGVPSEGVGFSNNPQLHLKGPRFKDAAFMVGKDGARVQVKLLYLKGKRPSDVVSSPEEAPSGGAASTPAPP